MVGERERGKKERYYEELSYIFMEAEESHNLPNANWSPRETSGLIQFKSQGLRTKGRLWFES